MVNPTLDPQYEDNDETSSEILESPILSLDVIPRLMSFVANYHGGQSEETRRWTNADESMRADLANALGVRESYLAKNISEFPTHMSVSEWPSYYSILSLWYGTTNNSVKISWSQHGGISGKIDSIEKDDATPLTQNWIAYESGESAILLHEDPWISRVDRKLFHEYDQFGENFKLYGRSRGHLYHVSYQPVPGKALQILYHLDTYGVESFRWLSARVISGRGKVVEERFNHEVPNEGDTEVVTISKIGKYQFKSHISMQQFITDAIFPRKVRKRDPKKPWKEAHDRGYYIDHWGIVRLD